MPNPGGYEPNFVTEHGKIIWPILGVIGGLVLLVGGYAIWRGPQRAFIPPCISKKFRRSIVDGKNGDLDADEKNFPGMGRVPSPVRIPQRVETGRQGRRDVVSSADAFKQEVVAARERGSVEWINGSDVGESGHSLPPKVHIAKQTGSPISDSGTLVGSSLSFNGNYNDNGGKPYLNEQSEDSSLDVVDTLPYRSKSPAVPQYQFADGTPFSSVSLYPSLPPTAAVTNGRPRGEKRISTSTGQSRYAANRDKRYTRSSQSQSNPYAQRMKDSQDSHVW